MHVLILIDACTLVLNLCCFNRIFFKIRDFIRVRTHALALLLKISCKKTLPYFSCDSTRNIRYESDSHIIPQKLLKLTDCLKKTNKAGRALFLTIDKANRITPETPSTAVFCCRWKACEEDNKTFAKRRGVLSNEIKNTHFLNSKRGIGRRTNSGESRRHTTVSSLGSLVFWLALLLISECTRELH